MSLAVRSPVPANKTRSIRDALFAGFLCLSLLGPLALWMAEEAGDIPLPPWLASEDAVYLAGGQTRGDIPGAASWEGFASGELQDAVESEVGSFIPAKATALFTTAGMQRGAIEASNALFGWNCYPTFYDSDIVAVPSEARLAEMAQVRTEPWTQEVSRTAEDVAAFAERHPELRVLAYVGPDSQNVAGSPTGELMSDPVTYDGLQALFKEHAGPFEWVSGAVTYDEFWEIGIRPITIGISAVPLMAIAGWRGLSALVMRCLSRPRNSCLPGLFSMEPSTAAVLTPPITMSSLITDSRIFPR